MIEIPKAALRRIARDHGLDAVVLFGSRARGTARPDSDVDLCVVGGRPAAGGGRTDGLDLNLRADLSRALRADVDLVRFERAGPLLRYHAVFLGKLLCGSPRLFRRLRLRAWKERHDARKINDWIRAALDRAG